MLFVVEAQAFDAVGFTKIVAREDMMATAPDNSYEILSLGAATVDEGGGVLFQVSHSLTSTLAYWQRGSGLDPLLTTGGPVLPGIEVPCTRPGNDCGPPLTKSVNRFSFAPGGLAVLEYVANETRAGTSFTGAEHAFLAALNPTTGVSFEITPVERIGGHRVLGFCPQADAVLTSDSDGGRTNIWFRSATENRRILRTLEPLPGLPNTQLLNANALLYTTNTHGEGLIPVSLQVDGSAASGLLVVDAAGGLNPVALFNTPHPAHPELTPGGTWQGVDSQMMNDSGEILFVSRVTHPDGGFTSAYSLWLGSVDDPHNPRLLLSSAQPVTIPGIGEVTPTWFNSPVLSSDGSVYVIVTYRSPPPDGIGTFESNFNVLCEVDRNTGDLKRLLGPANAYRFGAGVPGYPGSSLADIETAIVSTNDRLAMFVKFVDADSVTRRALVAEDRNGNLGTIAFEGTTITFNDIVPFEAEVATIDFAHDLGANGIHRNGQTGLSTCFGESGRLVLKMGLKLDADPNTSVPHLVAVDFASDVVPVGNEYHWAGGAGTNDWHTVADGRSNWVDQAGTPWPTPPGSGSRDEVVVIGSGYTVELNQPARVYSVTISDGGNSELVLNADLTFETLCKIPFLSQLTMASGKLSSAAGTLEMKGTLLKSTSASAEIDLAILKLEGENFLMEDGSLTLHNGETWFNGSSFEQTGGSLTFTDQLTRIQGDAMQFRVEAGLLDLQSELLSLETNTVLDVPNREGSIYFGKKSDTSAIQLVGGTSGNLRVLELRGVGIIELRTGCVIGANERLILNHTAPFDEEGIIINSRQPVFLEEPFTNETRITLWEGILRGSFANEGLIVADGNPFATREIDCLKNYGVIRQVQDLSGNLIHKDLARFEIRGGVFTRKEDSLLIFEQGSHLVARDAGGAIQRDNAGAAGGPVFDLNAVEIDVEDGSHLRVEGSRMTDSVKARIGKNGRLEFDGLTFEELHIEGEGTCRLEGDITCTLDGSATKADAFHQRDPALKIETNRIEVDNAKLFSDSGKNWFQIGTWLTHPNIWFATQSTEISNSVVERSVLLHVVHDCVVDQLEFNSFGDFSDIVLEGDLTHNLLDVSETGAPVPEFEAHALIAASPGNTVHVTPKFLLQGRNMITVRENCRLHLSTYTTAYDADSQTLLGGQWNIYEGGHLSFINQFGEVNEAPVLVIGKNALLIIKSGSGEQATFPGFPSRNAPLVVQGYLNLDGTVLQMNGNILTIDGGRIEWMRVEGDLKSVSPDIDGVIELARVEGDLEVSGNAEIGGLLGVGASPGAGVIGGDLTLTPASEVHFEIAGDTPVTDFDQLTVDGTTTLGGKLVLYPWNDYEIQPGEAFLLIACPDIEGNFAEIDQSALGRQLRLTLTVEPEGLVARAVPLVINSFNDWQDAFFTGPDAADPSISGPGEDIDGDGWSHLLEYALGGSPYAEDSLALTMTPRSDGGPGLPVLISFDWYAAGDAAYAFAYTHDFTTWSTARILEVSGEDRQDYERVTVVLDEPAGPPSSSTFLRLEVFEDTTPRP